MRNNNIDLNKILKRIETMSQSELNSIIDLANNVYGIIDVPIVLLNNAQIKSNTLIIAMFLIGKEIGKAENADTTK